MEEGEKVSILSRRDLRKQKLLEYLATKEKLKQPNPKANFHVDCPVKMPVTAQTAVKGKENKVPAQRFGYEATNVKSLAAPSRKLPTTASFGVSSKTNVKRSILDKQKNDNCPSAVKGSAQPNKNSVPRSRYTVISSTSNLNTSKHVKKQPNAGMTYSVQNPVHSAALRTISRFNTRSNATLSVPRKTVSARMSHGPVFRTKTGLISAVTQPRNTYSHLMLTSATAPGSITTSGSVNRAISHPSSSVSISQRSAVVPRKTISTNVVNNPIKRTAVCLTSRSCKFEDQKKFILKPHLAKPSQSSCKTQISSKLKSASLSSKCKAADIKPERKVGMSATNRSAGQHTDRSTMSRSKGNGGKTDSLVKVTSQTSSGLSTRCSSREVSGAPVAELVGKTMKCKEMQNKKGHSSANVLSQKTTIKRTDVPIMSKTVPLPARTIGITGKPTERKPPKVLARAIPQTEGKKVTAAQEERMKKLQEWKEAKGISYKRPPMSVKPQVRRTVAVPQPFWTAMKEEDEAHSLICAVDRSLADCMKLLGEGCPPDQVKEVLSRLPLVSRKFAKYWMCQARLMEQEGNLDVLPMFKEAVRVVLEPVDELRTVVFEILKKKDKIQEKAKDEHLVPAHDGPDESCNSPVTTPKPVRALISGETGNSSVVKYKITATPGGSLSQRREPARVDGQEVRFFTPVRRSVRIERASGRYPASLQDHDLCVASYNDLLSEEGQGSVQEQNSGETSPSANDTPMYIYRPNEALKDKVLVKLVYDD